MTNLTIFLASSNELLSDRQQFELFINRRNKLWASKGIFLHLTIWEDFLDALSKTRLQDEYNKAIQKCDILVLLFFTKVGKYTREEFETAFAQFQAKGRPLIYTYCKDATPGHPVSKDDTDSLQQFKDRLAALGHFPTLYKNTDQLLFHFSQQLDKLAADGFIALDPSIAAQAPIIKEKNIVGGNISNTGNIRVGDKPPAPGPPASGASSGASSSGVPAPGGPAATPNEHYDKKNIIKGDINNAGDITIGDGH